MSNPRSNTSIYDLMHCFNVLREVAEQTGFNDVSHFVATFRKKEGVTPGKYRQLHLSGQPVAEE